MHSILISKLYRKYHKVKSSFWFVGLVSSLLFLFFYLISQTLSKEEHLKELAISKLNLELNVLQTKQSHTKILCYIPLSKGKLRVAQVIKETWGSKCDKLLFYGNFHGVKIPEKYLSLNINFAQVNVTERYDLLWGKTKAILSQLYYNYGHVSLLNLNSTA